MTTATKAPETEKLKPLNYLVAAQEVEFSDGSARRWATEGFRRKDGQIIKLKVKRFGCRFYCCQQWLDEFFAATAAE